MATTLRILAASLFVAHATAKQCQTINIPVEISSRQGVFKEVPVESNLDVGGFATRFTQFQFNYSAELFTGFQTLEKSIEISAQYCTPDGGSKGIAQVLTHGIGFDKTYALTVIPL